MTDTQPVATSAVKGRSPSYPSHSLRVAVDRLRTLYDQRRRHSLPREILLQTIGYKSPDSGPAGGMYSSLKKYGLIDEMGRGKAREARVSQLGYEILEHPMDHERAAALERAALLPPIHKEMWQAYGRNLPGDDLLLWRLREDRGFTETGAKEFLAEWKDTLLFANLPDVDAGGRNAELFGPDDEDEDGPIEVGGELSHVDGVAPWRRPLPAQKQAAIEQLTAKLLSQPDAGRTLSERVEALAKPAERLTLPLVDGHRLELSGFPISERAWNQMLVVLDAMKPGLLTDEHES